MIIINKANVVFQQKNLSNFKKSAFSKYCLIIINAVNNDCQMATQKTDKEYKDMLEEWAYMDINSSNNA